MARRALLLVVVVAAVALGWRLWPGLTLPSFGGSSGSDEAETAETDDEPAPRDDVAAAPRVAALAAAPVGKAYDPWDPPPRDPFAPHLDTPEPQDEPPHGPHRRFQRCYHGSDDLAVRITAKGNTAGALTTFDVDVEAVDGTKLDDDLVICLRAAAMGRIREQDDADGPFHWTQDVVLRPSP